MTTLLRKLRLVLSGSPRPAWTAAFFILCLLALMAMLWHQVRVTSDIEHPVGRQHISGMVGSMAPAGRDIREVLVLNSYHLGYSWSDNEMRGIVEMLHQADAKVQPIIDYLDCKHYPGMEHFDRLCDLFVQKYRSKDFRVVIVADNPALEFTLRYRSRIFPRAVIVFCGVNGFQPKMIEGQENVTGIAELLDADGTLDMALKLHPAVRKVVVVHDYTITGLSTRRETEEQLKPFAGRVEIEYLPNQSMDELLARLRRLPPETLVLALSYSLDRDGQVINHEKIARLLSENSPVPIYGLHEERLGFGIVGGRLLGGRPQGARAAELAARILAGESASGIPVDIKSPTRAMFDHNQLVRFKIPPRSLPPEAIIVNLPVSFVSEHPGLVVTTLGIFLLLIGGIAVLGLNVYRRTIAEEEQRRLQGQLMQAQKMEAVGHLAGGVAHDFNNILTAVIGFAGMLRARVLADGQLSFYADQILSAANRATRLTQSLLAFSRKQVIEPKPVDLNDIVQGIFKIAKRLIGEDIEFRTALKGSALTVMADTSQMEQVLLNLCTNARDAMPRGGALSIETDIVDMNDAERNRNALPHAGRYGVICVSDTGTGMDDETRKHIFEPFFTTKEAGKGTGLGLSIVYGIVKQHNGAITVSSDPGRGTTFRIFLPLIAASADQEAPAEEAQPAGGGEVLLLAEDEHHVRGLISLVLRDAGYTVIEAQDGEDAVQKFTENADRIVMLISDVIMPKKNGREAFAQIRALRPGVKVLFVSGYAADIIEGKGILQEGIPFLAKPLIPDQLLRKVREVLDGDQLPAGRNTIA